MLLQEPLATYGPRWVRDGAGVSFWCPGHKLGDHRVQLYFDNPLDGEVAHEPGPFVHRLGDELEDLTLASVGNTPEDPILLFAHWRGWIVHSTVIYSVQTAARGVAW